MRKYPAAGQNSGGNIEKNAPTNEIGGFLSDAMKLERNRRKISVITEEPNNESGEPSFRPIQDLVACACFID
jgi:hypothetical protein